MSTIKSRLAAIEEKNEIEVLRKQRAFFASKSEDELEFYATNRCFPDDPAIEPRTTEFVINGWKTTVILERV
jgi:hypothetical protein